jgi:hypothetical protein
MNLLSVIFAAFTALSIILERIIQMPSLPSDIILAPKVRYEDVDTRCERRYFEMFLEESIARYLRKCLGYFLTEPERTYYPSLTLQINSYFTVLGLPEFPS